MNCMQFYSVSKKIDLEALLCGAKNSLHRTKNIEKVQFLIPVSFKKYKIPRFNARSS